MSWADRRVDEIAAESEPLLPGHESRLEGRSSGGSMPDRESPSLLTAELGDFGNGVKLLRLGGEVDISSAHMLSTQLEKVARTGFSTVIIDASEVTFMDSTGVHALVGGKRLIHENETEIVLVISPQVRRVLELVFPDPLFAARFDSVDDALRALDEKTRG